MFDQQWFMSFNLLPLCKTLESISALAAFITGYSKKKYMKLLFFYFLNSFIASETLSFLFVSVLIWSLFEVVLVKKSILKCWLTHAEFFRANIFEINNNYKPLNFYLYLVIVFDSLAFNIFIYAMIQLKGQAAQWPHPIL